MHEPPGQPRWIPSENHTPPSRGPADGLHAAPAKPHRERNILISAGVLLAILAAIGFAMPGTNKTALANSAASTPTSPSAPVASPAAAAPSSAPTDCTSQLQDWFNNGGSSQIKSFGTDIGALGGAIGTLGTDLSTGADASADETTVQSDAATIQSDSQALQADPPPSCVPGLRLDMNAAAGYYSTAAIDASNCLNQLSAGDVTVADGDIQAALAALNNGNAKLQTATADVQTFNSSQG